MKTALLHPESQIDRQKILEYFDRFKKDRDRLLLGVEAELLGVDSQTGLAIPYEGSNGIEGLFEEFIIRFGWKPIQEWGKTIGLKRGESEIHLEPGGQLEFSGTPYLELSANLKEIQEYHRDLKEISLDKGIAWLELGIQPFSELSSISWVPKDRYRILSDYLAQKGPLSHRMMKQTATLQANLDYIDSRDAMKKLRTAMGVAPIMIGLFANSPLLEGKTQGCLSLRSEVWRYTDPDRCGLIREVLIDEPHIENYIQYLLKVPVIFIVRDKNWIAVDGRTFEKFLEEGYLGFKPTEADWKLFLTSIFTEARLNPFVELRSSDRNPLNLSFAMLALWKGILFDEEAREAAWHLVRDWTFEERVQFCAAAAYRALKAKLRAYTLEDLALELIHYAEQALKKRWRQKLSQEDESVYLEPVKQLLDDGMSPAEKLLLFWNGSWNRDPRKLVEYCRI